jgi:putative nucleotidyltransferase with HDIG domain
VARDVLEAALDGRAWKQDAEAFAESTGTVVAVLTSAGQGASVRCPVCLVSSGDRSDSLPTVSCFREGACAIGSEAVLTTCRGGMACALSPVPGQQDASVMVSGYVSSDGERRELLGRLLVAGLPEKQARAIARATPLLRPEAARALARLAASHLAALLVTFDEGNERALEYELLYEIGRGFDERLGDYEHLPEVMLDRAMKLTSADAGAVYLLEGDVLEIAASRGEPALLPQGPARMGEGTVGEAAERRRALLVTGFADARRAARSSVLAVPLTADGGILGVLSLVADSAGSPLAGADLELMELFAESAGRALANSRRYSEANARVLELMQLNELSKALHADAELDRVTYLVTSVLDKLLEFEVGGLLLLGREEPARVVVRADVERGSLESLLAQAAGLVLPPRFLERCALVQNEGAVTEGDGEDDRPWRILVEDVSTSRPNAGFLFVATRETGGFDADDARLLHAQAAHASVALEKSRTYARLRGDLDKLVSTLSAMADAAERTAGGHAGRVMAYALAVGEEMDLPHDQLEALRFAGLLHDIGKLGVSEEIILKPARLTAEEMAEVRRHAEIGADIVDQMEFLEAVAPIVLHHHERWDGAGYPKGLAREDIPLPARILAVADAFDAMTCERSYSKALPIASARIELERGAGEQFDPEVVAAFLAVLDRGLKAASAGLFGVQADDGRPQLPA